MEYIDELRSDRDYWAQKAELHMAELRHAEAMHDYYAKRITEIESTESA